MPKTMIATQVSPEKTHKTAENTASDISSTDSNLVKPSASDISGANSRLAITTWQNIPPVLAKKIRESADTTSALALSAVNRHYRSTIPGLTTVSLFKANYSEVKHENNQFMLPADKITAAQARAGNRLITHAMSKIHDGKLAEAEQLIYRAMYRHGCVAAMKFIKMFSNLPGRTKLNPSYNLDALITIHTKAENEALKAESKLYPFALDAKENIVSDLNTILGIFNLRINQSIEAYRITYNANHFKSVYLNSLISQLNDNDMNGVQPAAITCKKFNAAGFIGYDAPTHDDWYLTTTSQKNHEALERAIDLSTNNVKESIPTIYMKK